MSEPVSERKEQKRNRKIRIALLIAVLVATTAIGLMHQFLKEGAPVGVDALCPFGALESAFTLVYSGVMLQKIAVSSFILFLAVMLVAIVFRRSFCGYICPLGTLQELFANLGRRFMKNPPVIPAAIDRPARYLKYVVLVLVVVLSAAAGELIIRPYDPWVTYNHLTSGELFEDFSIGFIILLLTLVGSVFYNRVFCKYLCPMGAFLALFFKLGWFGIRRNPDTCVGCGACSKVCPVDIDVTQSNRVNNVECISCNECVNVCPVEDTLFIAGPKMNRVQAKKVLGAVVVIFALVIGVTSFTGDFAWENPTLQAQVEAVGGFDSELIKGRMPMQEVIDTSGIPAQAFVDEFKLDEKDIKVPMKDITEKYDFEVEDVRVFVDEYLKNK